MGYGLLSRARSLVRRGRAVVAASPACRDRCCGPTTPPTYCQFCPCAQDGCWAVRPIIYIRSDVLCQDGYPVCGDGTTNPRAIMVRYNGWCYEGPTADAPPVPPPGAIVIDPPAVLECVPVSNDYPTACEHPACLPAGGGDCLCANCQAGDNGCACNHVCDVDVGVFAPPGECSWCCGGGLNPDRSATWTPFWTFRRIVRQFNGPWDCNCIQGFGQCGGENYRLVTDGRIESIQRNPNSCSIEVVLRLTTTEFRRIRCGGQNCPCNGDVCRCCFEQQAPDVQFFPLTMNYGDALPPDTGIYRIWDTGGVEQCTRVPGPCEEDQDHVCHSQTCFNCHRGLFSHNKCTQRTYSGGSREGRSGIAGPGCCYTAVTESVEESLTFLPGTGVDGPGCCSMCLLSHCGTPGGPSGGQDCTTVGGGGDDFEGLF
jgi:hypothetical protein